MWFDGHEGYSMTLVVEFVNFYIRIGVPLPGHGDIIIPLGLYLFNETGYNTLEVNLSGVIPS
jgi:hypothetical protein